MQVDEIDRLKTVLSYNLLDTPPEKELDALAELVSLVCETPIAIISLIDGRRQWYKAKVGVEADEVPIGDSFCQFTLENDGLLEIPQAKLDPRVKDKPAAQGEKGIQFYAGIPLKASNGHNIGTVCVASSASKILTDKQKKAFELLAIQAMAWMEAKKMNRNLGIELRTIVDEQIKRIENRVQQKESEINALLQAISLSNGVVEFSPEGTIQSANEIFAGFLGYAADSLKGVHHSNLLFEEDLIKNEEFWRNLNDGEFKSGQMKRKHQDGKEIWILATYNPILDAEGKVSKVIKIAQEITQSIESRNLLQKDKERADYLNIQKDNFIANVSHEIRTPIHAILGFTQLLLDEETDASKFTYLNAVKSAGDNLLFIINDILDLSKIESGQFRIDHQHFDLPNAIQDLHSFLQLRASQKKITFSHHIDARVPQWILGDKNRLSQILINLIGNAIKFTEKGSVTLRIELLRETKSKAILKFRVIDTGIGVPTEKLGVIFDRFSQSDEKISRKYGGTGLGLNISKSLVEKMNGTIEVSSKEGKGSEFSFTISFPKSKDLPELRPQEKFEHQEGDPIRVLLCEDNELNQILVKNLLIPPQFELQVAASGVEGIKLFKEKVFDIVLMDIQMPVMDGYQATEVLIHQHGTQVPIVGLSANYMIKEKQKCLDLGMCDYLSKPFKREELFEKIYKWTSKESRTSSSNGVSRESEVILKPPVDLDILKEFSDGNEDFEQQMIRMFLDQITNWKTDCKMGIEAGDFQKIKADCHRLNSSFGVIGADYSGLREIQQFAEIEDLNGIKVVYEGMLEYLGRVEPFLESKLK